MQQCIRKIKSVDTIQNTKDRSKITKYLPVRLKRMSFCEVKILNYNYQKYTVLKTQRNETHSMKDLQSSKYKDKDFLLLLSTHEKLNNNINSKITPLNENKNIPNCKSSISCSLKSSKDFKGMMSKCLKLKLKLDYFLNNTYLKLGSGHVTQIHQCKGIGQIKLEHSEDQVRFHRIDFQSDWWLMTVAFALQVKKSFLYSTHPVDNHEDSKELFLVDHNFLRDLRLIVSKQGIRKCNYYKMLGQCSDLPYVMKRFYEQSKRKDKRFEKNNDYFQTQNQKQRLESKNAIE